MRLWKTMDWQMTDGFLLPITSFMVPRYGDKTNVASLSIHNPEIICQIYSSSSSSSSSDENSWSV